MTDADPDHPEILISDRQSAPVDEEALIALGHEVLAGEGVRHGELSVSLVTPEEMADLHARYMGEEGPTDVLSFPQDGDAGLLGDVVICPAEAEHNNPDLEAEIKLLLVHGILHLLGYDHEDEADRAQMWARQEHYVGTR